MSLVRLASIKFGMVLGILKFRGSKPIKCFAATPAMTKFAKNWLKPVANSEAWSVRTPRGQRYDGSSSIMKDSDPIKMNINSYVGADTYSFMVKIAGFEFVICDTIAHDRLYHASGFQCPDTW
ncbi:uncharacterized protein N7518_003132 [Penicillium psychrosexuale]|uniref:uncharacterized protein n=1 Tax=Penicillium psychrosexuale TaxID=1002107 RepID=UPI002544F47A|nr:uncharacterized protein N7518_003132 [Penicillium psychrosexuale]KAJ5801064.1 hypothetical protein N7518_003132 [Penicillium psychrosexuale]